MKAETGHNKCAFCVVPLESAALFFAFVHTGFVPKANGLIPN